MSSYRFCYHKRAKARKRVNERASTPWTCKGTAAKADTEHSCLLTSKHFISPRSLRNHEETTNGAADTCLPPYPIPCRARLTGHGEKTAGKISYSVIRRFFHCSFRVWHLAKGDVAIFSMRYKIHRAEPNKNCYQVIKARNYVNDKSRAAKRKRKQSVTHRLPLLYTMLHDIFYGGGDSDVLWKRYDAVDTHGEHKGMQMRIREAAQKHFAASLDARCQLWKMR